MPEKKKKQLYGDVINQTKGKFKPGEKGFLKVDHDAKVGAMGIGGDWKMLYKADDQVKGPGMKKKKETEKSKPKPPEPISIKVETPEGKTVSLQVLPTDSLNSVKDEIEYKTGIPKAHQKLFFNGKKLDNNSKDMKEYGIQNGSKLKLDGMKITVKDWFGDKHLLDVLPSDSIEKVQDKIWTVAGIPKDNQRLYYGSTSLSNKNKTLVDYGIPDKSTLDLEGMKISINTPSGKVTLSVDPQDTINNVKRLLEDQVGIPPDAQRLLFGGKELADKPKLSDCNIKHGATLDLEPMQVSVKIPDGQTVKVDVNPSDTIDDVKEKVKGKTGIPKSEQRVNFKGKELPDDSTLSENGIKHGDSLSLDPMKIFVTDPKGKKFSVDVQPSDTVGDVKDLIKQQRGIPKDQQRLLYCGKPLDDRKTLRDCNVKHKENLDLDGMKITVRTPTGKKLSLDVKPDDKVKDVKDKLRDLHGIPKEEQVLSFGGVELNDNSTLSHCNIKDGSALDLEDWEISVRDPNGSRIKLKVKPSDTIDAIKDKIFDQEGIPVNEQRLAFNHTNLDNGRKKISDYGIKHGSLLDLEPMEITVKTPDGKPIKIKCNPDDTVHQVKTKVAKQSGIPNYQQRIMFRGMELNDDDVLDDCGVKHESSLDLAGMKINIKDWKGKTFAVDVAPGDTIDQVKDKIAEKQGIPKENQFLLHSGKELDKGSNTLSGYGIEDGATLNLDRMKIYVKTLNGKTALYVDPTDTIESVKRQIQEKEGIVPDKQRLKLGDDLLNDNGKTLEECGVGYKSLLTLDPPKPVLKSPKGNSKKLAASSDFDSPKATSDKDVPTYKVSVGPWQSPMEKGYSPKPKIKREGVRARKHYNRMGDFYQTTLNTDREANNFQHNVEKEPSK